MKTKKKVHHSARTNTRTRTVQGLVKDECAYHDNINSNNKIANYCYTEEMPDDVCLYFMDNPDDYWIIRCRYFEECVLPLDKELEALYYAKIEAEKNNKTLTAKEIKEIKEENKVTKTCENIKCKKEFKPSSNRQKYCNKCKKEIAKNKQKEWIRNKREDRDPPVDV